ncbi:MAG: hypothetical protein ABJB12_16020, partial [Pseudomonadota bacterium]
GRARAQPLLWIKTGILAGVISPRVELCPALFWVENCRRYWGMVLKIHQRTMVRNGTINYQRHFRCS